MTDENKTQTEQPINLIAKAEEHAEVVARLQEVAGKIMDFTDTDLAKLEEVVAEQFVLAENVKEREIFLALATHNKIMLGKMKEMVALSKELAAARDNQSFDKFIAEHPING